MDLPEPVAVVQPFVAVLAAGAASRMGQPKQLLPWGDGSLLQHALDAAEHTGWPVVLVLGAYYEQIEDQLAVGPNTRVVRNQDWPTGLSTSVRAALAHAPTGTDAAVFCVGDQPFMSAEVLKMAVTNQNQTRKGIVAAAYDQTFGVPMLFHQRYFPQLHTLTGDQGAKKIALQHLGDLATFEFPLGRVDLDTFEEYTQLRHASRPFRT